MYPPRIPYLSYYTPTSILEPPACHLPASGTTDVSPQDTVSILLHTHLYFRTPLPHPPASGTTDVFPRIPYLSYYTHISISEPPSHTPQPRALPMYPPGYRIYPTAHTPLFENPPPTHPSLGHYWCIPQDTVSILLHTHLYFRTPLPHPPASGTTNVSPRIPYLSYCTNISISEPPSHTYQPRALLMYPPGYRIYPTAPTSLFQNPLPHTPALGTADVSPRIPYLSYCTNISISEPPSHTPQPQALPMYPQGYRLDPTAPTSLFQNPPPTHPSLGHCRCIPQDTVSILLHQHLYFRTPLPHPPASGTADVSPRIPYLSYCTNISISEPPSHTPQPRALPMYPQGYRLDPTALLPLF